jgi:hypothetical protein
MGASVGSEVASGRVLATVWTDLEGVVVAADSSVAPSGDGAVNVSLSATSHNRR